MDTGSFVTFSGTNPMAGNNQQIDIVASSSAVEIEVLELPLNWEEVSGTDGDAAYFWNTVTNETQYERPLH